MLSELKTDRQVFEYVKNHLLKQNQQSMAGNGCVYRGPQGRSCAVGCLIADEFYDEFFENEWLYSEDVSYAVSKSLPNWSGSKDSVVDSFTAHRENASLKMLYFLQNIHDNSDPYTWEHDLIDLESKIFDDYSQYVSKDIHLYDWYALGKRVALITEIQAMKELNYAF